MSLFGWFGVNKQLPILRLSHSDFAPGLIIKMNPGCYTKHPYYVEVITVEQDYIITNIPSHHQCKIRVNSYEWDYHIPRMTIIGNKSEFGHLLYNQPLD